MKHFIYINILPYIGLIFIKLLSLTYRIIIINPEIEKRLLERGETPIYISWHQRLFLGLTFLAKRHPIAIIISQSRDGDLIARIAEILGWHPIRGSSSKGGRRSLIQILNLMKEGYKIGHIVDGPRGPFGKIKPGLLAIAKLSGKPILPIIISAEKKWIFNSWDKFIIPKPFSRIIIRFDTEIYIPKNIQKKKIEETIISLENKLEELYRDTDNLLLKNSLNIFLDKI